MKLYATTTSERGKSVAKGGNEFLEIELKAFDRQNAVGTILLTAEEDASGAKNQYLVQWQDAEDKEHGEYRILLEGHKDEGVIQRAEK